MHRRAAEARGRGWGWGWGWGWEGWGAGGGGGSAIVQIWIKIRSSRRSLTHQGRTGERGGGGPRCHYQPEGTSAGLPKGASPPPALPQPRSRPPPLPSDFPLPPPKLEAPPLPPSRPTFSFGTHQHGHPVAKGLVLAQGARYRVCEHDGTLRPAWTPGQAGPAPPRGLGNLRGSASLPPSAQTRLPRLITFPRPPGWFRPRRASARPKQSTHRNRLARPPGNSSVRTLVPPAGLV